MNDLGARNFDDAVEELKKSGFTITRGEKGWVHLCPNCVRLSTPM
jgi:hypothetical protein